MNLFGPKFDVRSVRQVINFAKLAPKAHLPPRRPTLTQLPTLDRTGSLKILAPGPPGPNERTNTYMNMYWWISYHFIYKNL